MNRVSIITFDTPRAGLNPSALWQISTRRAVTWPAQKQTEFGLHYILKGAVRYRFDRWTVQAGPGDILFVNPGDTLETHRAANTTNYHAHFTLAPQSTRHATLTTAEWRDGLARQLDHAADYARSFFLPDHLEVRARDRIGEWCTDMLNAQTARAPGHALAHNARFLLLLQLVSDELVRLSTDTRPHTAPDAAGVHVARALQLIESALGEPMSRAALAAELGLTPDYLGKIFKKSLRRSIGAYILERRMALARELLIAPGMSIKQVARRTGFRDSLYFSRVFCRENSGVSPTRYVRNHVHPNREPQQQP